MDQKVQKISILDDKTAKKFAKDPQTRAFKLNSSNSFLTDKGIKYLCSAKNSQHIEEIDLSDNFSCITDESLFALATAPYANKITKLRLKDTEISDLGLQQFIHSANFNKIQELSLYGLFLVTDQTLFALAESYFVGGLEKLCLRNTGVTDRGLEALTLSPNCTKLKEFDISENFPRVSGQALFAIGMSEYISGLKIFNCMGNRVNEKGLHMLLDSRNVLELEELDVSEHSGGKNEGVDDGCLATMAYSHYLRNLRILNLRSTSVSGKGLSELFASYNIRKLEVLRISNNKKINDIAILALMESDNLYNLRKLYINDTSVSPEAIENLKRLRPLLDVIY